jgi:Tol biopolymer transport system component
MKESVWIRLVLSYIVPMSPSPGTRLGAYEITAKLGEGGMGEVYRAKDTKLNRDVAIKVLPAAVAQDAERLARFKREAQVLASLNHPNIAAIYGLDEAGDKLFLVLELVDGKDLSERLTRGPIPFEEALEIAKQIAMGLEEAHDKGIVHRDLKPANVKLTSDGRVKVLDFGLAKAYASDRSGAVSLDSGNSPTMTHAATMTGMILGTAAYMSPEQAAGIAVDRRADVWSLGVVTFEMLTGRRLFDGETVSHVLAAVLKDTPDFSTLPPETPERIVDLLRRCLRKKPRERLQAVGDARVVIEEVLADPRGGVRAAPVAARASKLPWAVAAGALLAAAVFAALWLGSGGGRLPSRALQAALVAPSGTAFGDTLAISPDGSRVVFEAFDRKTGTRSLWLRSLDRGEPTRLPATDGGEMPFWSPDGNHLGFFADGKLKRLDPQGGPAQVISDAPTPRGGAWGTDGRIVFAPAFRTGLSIVPAAGGAPTALTTLDESRHEKSHRFPVFLPGGKAILFLAQTAEGGARNDESAIEALDLSSGKRTRLISVNSSMLFDPGGNVLFWRDGTLFAQPVDPESLKLSGDPAPVAAPVAFTQNEQMLATVSGDGTLIFREGARGTFSSLVWLDRNGVGTQSIRERELFDELALSYDGTRLAYTVNSPGHGATDLWIHDLARDAASRLTFDEGGENYPVWSRDDRYVYYASDRRNDGTIYRRSSDGTGEAVEIGTTESGMWPMAVSLDGRWLVVGSVGPQSGRDLFRFDVATKALTPLVATSSHDDYAALSPDDRFLAYASEQSGRFEIYVQALGSGSGTWQISRDGGLRPRWRADGRELFFLSRPDALMSAPVEPGDVPRFGAPRELFRHPTEDFAVTPDGQRIVALHPADSDLDKPLMVLTNWRQRMTKR